MRIFVIIGFALMLFACGPPPVTEAESRIPLGADDVTDTSPLAVKIESNQTAPSDQFGHQSELQEIATNISHDATLGVFVATNRRLLDLTKKSFMDQRSDKLTYGLAYQKVAATPTGVRPRQNLSLELAQPDQFFGYIKAREVEATRYPNHVIVFVHGFNQTPQQAMTTAVAVKSLLRFDGPFVLFMWPSMGAIRNYGTDRLNAEVSDRAFGQLLCRLASRDSGAKVTILAHSMGNYLTANTLQRFAGDCPKAPKLNALVMLSPDLPISVLEARGEQVLSAVGSATAYVSEYDLAVTSSEKVWDVDNFGLVHNRLPTVFPGISSINVSSLQLGPFDLESLSHDSYAYTQVMDDIYRLLAGGGTNPVLRSTRIRAMKRRDNQLIFYIMDGDVKRP